MRGKRSAWEKLIDEWRITPADAGKTHISKSPFSVLQDHPRGCGENRKGVDKSDTVQGSPPRMRGKLTPAIYHTVQPGITPADAGKTLDDFPPQRGHPDHPRGCGENFAVCVADAGCDGSPPRMRGKLGRFICRPMSSRITPADAGKTSRHSRKSLTA